MSRGNLGYSWQALTGVPGCYSCKGQHFQDRLKPQDQAAVMMEVRTCGVCRAARWVHCYQMGRLRAMNYATTILGSGDKHTRRVDYQLAGFFTLRSPPTTPTPFHPQLDYSLKTLESYETCQVQIPGSILVAVCRRTKIVLTIRIP